MKITTLKHIITATAAFTFVACSDSDKKTDTSSKDIGALSGTLSKYDANAFPLNKLVCDPFGGGTPVESPKNGIKASLYYKGTSGTRYYKVMDYINKSTKSEQTLFFNRIDVPTRMFTEGFPLKTGGKIADDSGQSLIEFFALKFESSLQLTATDEEGDYEIALLSDDGTVLNIKDPSIASSATSWETLISNDGDTPTRMGCSSRVIHMTRDKKIPFEFFYYQGPRYHIANMMIWRKSLTAGKDQDCGKSGNDYFFDPDHGSTPKAWTAMTQRGWKVIQDGNFILPSSNPTPSQLASASDANLSDIVNIPEQNYNACFDGQIPKIDNLNVDEITLTDIFLSWTTDIPSVAQVLVINVATGEKTLTSADNMLRTSHTVHISGLSPNTAYRVQAVSISQDLGKGISEALEVKTLGGFQ